jgi:hypothetical protein
MMVIGWLLLGLIAEAIRYDDPSWRRAGWSLAPSRWVSLALCWADRSAERLGLAVSPSSSARDVVDPGRRCSAAVPLRRAYRSPQKAEAGSTRGSMRPLLVAAIELPPSDRRVLR